MVELQRQPLSRDNPWPGLDPFDETDRDYFHGRAAESGELLRLVRREPLTVVFGRSGLGKTSLLKAGLFPLLRGEDHLPVYVRLDHATPATPADGTVVLWDLASRQPLATLAGDKGWVRSVAFSPDGKRLAVASENHTVILWDLNALLDLDFLKAEACRRANRNLTCNEWAIYLGADKPYNKTCEALPGPERCE